MWNKVVIRASIISQTPKAYLLKNGSITFFYPKKLIYKKNSNYLKISYQKKAETKYKKDGIEYNVTVEKLLFSLAGNGAINEINSD